jgi:hypothetical protein
LHRSSLLHRQALPPLEEFMEGQVDHVLEHYTLHSTDGVLSRRCGLVTRGSQPLMQGQQIDANLP